jgi:hypothetical protein
MSKAELEAKDARSKKTTEAIQNMKLLKLQGWVSCFQEEIQMYRTVRVCVPFVLLLFVQSSRFSASLSLLLQNRMN